jgi:rod shape determining protein RodA
MALMAISVISIYAAVYDDEARGIFDLSTRSGMQALWIGVALIIATFTLIIESRFYYVFAQILYGLSILLMIATLIFGREINGNKSWLYVGPIGLQPVEFMKLATALMLAKIMSPHSFRLQHFSDFMKALMVVAVPMALTFLQHDTGSALVFTAFIIVFYRAGLKPWIIMTCIFLIFLFILSLLLTEEATLILLGGLVLAIFMVTTRKFKLGFIGVAIIAAITCTLHYFLLLFDAEFELYESLLIAYASILPFAIIYALWNKLQYVLLLVGLFVLSVGLSFSVDYIFDNVLKEHQRNRINDTLGIVSDLKGAGYNVYQSKVAIGSGGFLGKGFLEGTQTKFNFIPEQSTDFIFCTIGEEWGFIGSLVVVGLYLLLLTRILNIAERQKKLFAKLCGYGVAAILFFHMGVNIGMTIGIMPVVGIPLPFVSYGGSSLWTFTILLFILLKLDVARYE